MPQSCIVKDCTNRWKKGSKISFHRIPAERSEPSRRRQWLSALNRKDWNPNDEDRVCGRHFIQGCSSQNPSHPDYIPTLHMGYKVSVTPETDRIQRYERTERRCKVKLETQLEKQLEEEERLSAAAILMDLSANTTEADVAEEVSDTENAGPDPEVVKLREELKLVYCQLRRLQEENRKLKEEIAKSKFGASFMAQGNSKKRTRFFTGLPSHEAFLWLLALCSSVLPVSRCLNPADVMMLILMKVKLGVLNQDLGYRFNIAASVVSRLLNAGLPAVAQTVVFLVRWPEKEEVLRSLPAVFKPAYKKCRVIIDCTEIFCERARNLSLRALTWSNYKHHNTLKILVGITPCGPVSFISAAYGGRVSDKVITQRSGFLDLLEHGDLVLADRGFLIEEDLAARGATLAIPAFTRGKRQLSMRDVEKCRRLSRVRIHVERMMERLKNFKILSQVLPLSLVPHADNIIMICAAISNLLPRLVK